MKLKLASLSVLLSSLLLVAGCDVAAQGKVTSVRTAWDYDFVTNVDVKGFNIYKKIQNGTDVSWVKVGDVKSPTVEFAIQSPYEGTYAVAAYNDYDESDKSNELKLTGKIPSPAKFRTVK